MMEAGFKIKLPLVRKTKDFDMYCINIQSLTPMSENSFNLLHNKLFSILQHQTHSYQNMVDY